MFDGFEKSTFTKISKGKKLKNVLSEIKVSSSGREYEACTVVEDVCLKRGVAVDQTQRSKVNPVVKKADSGRTSSQVSLRASKFWQLPPLAESRICVSKCFSKALNYLGMLLPDFMYGLYWQRLSLA